MEGAAPALYFCTTHRFTNGGVFSNKCHHSHRNEKYTHTNDLQCVEINTRWARDWPLKLECLLDSHLFTSSSGEHTWKRHAELNVEHEYLFFLGNTARQQLRHGWGFPTIRVGWQKSSAWSHKDRLIVSGKGSFAYPSARLPSQRRYLGSRTGVDVALRDSASSRKEWLALLSLPCLPQWLWRCQTQQWVNLS